MTDDIAEESVRFRLLTGIFGLAAAGAGLIALIGLVFGPSFLASLGSDKIPMAPSTALFFLLYGIAIFFHATFPMNRRIRRMGLAINLAGSVLALLLLFLSYHKVYLDIERLSIPVAGTVAGAPVGHMSPLTAFCFLLSSLSSLASLSRFSKRTMQKAVAFWSAGILVVTSLALLLAYLYGTPLLYGSSFIPPAATTTLAFLSLGTALLVLAVSPDRFSKIPDQTNGYFIHFFLLLFVILAVGIVAAGYFYYRNHEKHHRAVVESQLSAIADLKVRDLVQWRKERQGDAFVYYKNDGFSDLVRRYLESPGDSGVRKRLKTWISKVREAYQYDRVLFLDVQGKVRISAPEAPEPVAPLLARDVLQVLGLGKPTFLDFYRDSPDHPIFLSVMVPIFEEQDGILPLGVLILRINPETYLYPLIRSWPANSDTAETLLVRREGNDVLFLNELRYRKNTALNFRFPLDRKTDLPAAKAVLGKEGIVEGSDYRGVPVIASVWAVPDSPWFLIARMDISEVYAPLRERLWMIIVLVGSLLVGTGAGTGLIWRHQQSRFYRERYEAAQTLQASYRFLQIAYSYTETPLLLEEFVKEIKNYTGCDAVGIRILDEDGNIPYHTYKGFSKSFYESESPLSIKSDQCMCINIIKGDCDPRFPFYTAGGSFYMNGTTRFLETVSEDDKGKTRNICNQVGYESVALVPIRLKDRILGLIHVADHREDVVPLNRVEVLEKAGMQLGTAILRKRAEREILRLNAELEQRVIERTAQLAAANKELESFAYSVSHDLRAPLRRMDGFSRALIETHGDRLDGQGRHYLERIRAGARDMGNLVDDLLKLSRITRSEMKRKQVDLSEMVFGIAEELRKTGKDRDVEFRIQEGISVEGDPRLLAAALQNLFGNAWKFTGKKERGCITFGAKTNGTCGMRHPDLPDYVPVYFVRDDGAGFDMAYAERLFGAFQRLHRADEFEGSGIGLATVQRIVHRHGGVIWAEGEVGKGACFYFTLR